MGIPPARWMVYFMENPTKNWMMIWGYPYDLGNHHISFSEVRDQSAEHRCNFQTLRCHQIWPAGKSTILQVL